MLGAENSGGLPPPQRIYFLHRTLESVREEFVDGEWKLVRKQFDPFWRDLEVFMFRRRIDAQVTP